MILNELELAGVYALELERREDERGYFARTFCTEELAARGLEHGVAQISISFNPRRGTLRGMHVQLPPHEETKIVRCTQGAIHDVVVDLRGTSPSFGRWLAVELTADRGNAVYVPRGCAHGFLTLSDDSAVEYVISTPHEPRAAAGAAWNDPAIGVRWPFEPTLMSHADASYPPLDLDRLQSGVLSAFATRRVDC